MTEQVDWKCRAHHMLDRHQTTTVEADEALTVVDAVWFDPAPKGRTGRGIRVIGDSPTARAILTILVHNDESDDGYFSVNGWRSNSTERRIYSEGV